MRPTEGEARLISATIAGRAPTRARRGSRGARRAGSARARAARRAARAPRRPRGPPPSPRRALSSMSVIRFDLRHRRSLAAQRVERRARAAGCHRGPRARHPVVNVHRLARDDERERGVEQNQIGARPALAFEDREQRGRVRRRIAAANRRERRVHAVLRRVERPVPHAVAVELHDVGRRLAGDLVETVRRRGCTAPASPPELAQRVGDERDVLGARDADHLPVRAGRIRQRAEHVEDRSHAEFAADRRRPRASRDDGAARTGK